MRLLKKFSLETLARVFILGCVFLLCAFWLLPLRASSGEVIGQPHFNAQATTPQSPYIAFYRTYSGRWMSDLDWRLTWAQARQESLEDAWARNERSGALGVMQIMPSTAREIQRKLGLSCWPYGNARCSIVMGSYYQGRMTNQFRRRERTPLQAWELGAASYNGGLGYVLSAQQQCADARLWQDVRPCHPFAETRAYPISIWNRYLVIINQYPDLWSGDKAEVEIP